MVRKFFTLSMLVFVFFLRQPSGLGIASESQMLNTPPPQLAFNYHNYWWSASSFSADAAKYRTVAGDFNGDGKGDIAMVHRTNSTTVRFYVMLGADDHFDWQGIWLVLNGFLNADMMTGRVVAGDFNNDGFDDIAAFADDSQTILYVFLSDGSSGFSYENWWQGDGNYDAQITGRVVAGDFDGDGLKDDITTLYDTGNNSMRVDVFISGGNGFTYEADWFSRGSFIPDNASYRTVAGDVDADGDDDVVIVYKFADSVTHVNVLISSGTSFSYESKWWESTSYYPDQTTGRVVAGDFDGDGDEDVALLYDRDPSGTRADVLLSTREAFSHFSSINGWWSDLFYPAANVAGRVVAGDWNGNGVDDVGMIFRISPSDTRADVLESTAPAPEQPTTSQVDGDDPSCNNTGGTPFCTIQAAVDAASDGDIIQVAGGEYFEYVRAPKYPFPGFNQSLTIQGTGEDSTFVDGSASSNVFDIYEGGQIILSDLTIRNGNTSGNGSGVFNYSGVLIVNNSTIISNTTAASGGGIYNLAGSLTINNSSLGNNAAGIDGGGIFNNGGTVTLNSSVVSSNQSTDKGGGISNDGGLVNLNNSFVSNNHATDRGGGVFNLDGSLAINGSTFISNIGDNHGGGIYNLGNGSVTISDSVISGNSTGLEGGGIRNIYGTWTVIDSTFSNNTAGLNGGGIFNLNGKMTIVNTTLRNNVSNQYGGGVINLGGSLTFSNSTFSSNSALAASGGALYALGNDPLKITNSTFNGNSAGYLGGGIYAEDGTMVTLVNNIVANSTAGGDCAGPGTWNTAGAPNLDSDGTCPGFTITDNPLLRTLQDNGGATQTHALLDSSPAIDAGSNTACTATDQRGIPRPQDGDGDGTAVCDLGAYEFSTWYIYLPVVLRQ